MDKQKTFHEAREEQHEKVIKYLKENYPEVLKDFDHGIQVDVNSEGYVWIGSTEIKTGIVIDYNRNKKHIMQTNYSFTDQYKSTRTGFSHTSQFFINGALISEAKVNYINRTWESYTYQSSRRAAVTKAIEERLDYLCQSYKKDNNLTRLPNGYRTKVRSTDETIKTYKEIDKKL